MTELWRGGRVVEGGRFEIYFGCKLNAGSNPASSASNSRGEVTEWLKVHGWNPCVGQLTGGSNPPLSAIFIDRCEGRVPKTGTREPRQVREEATVAASPGLRITRLSPLSMISATIRAHEDC